jgi:hypothetical protein
MATKVILRATRKSPSVSSAEGKVPPYGTRIRYSSSLILQAGKQFYSVTIPTDVLAKCCYVTTRNEDPQAGFQRVLDKRRAQDICGLHRHRERHHPRLDHSVRPARREAERTRTRQDDRVHLHP